MNKVVYDMMNREIALLQKIKSEYVIKLIDIFNDDNY